LKVVIVGSGSIALRYSEIIESIHGSELQIVSDFQLESIGKQRVFNREIFSQQAQSGSEIYDLLIIASVNSRHITDFEIFSSIAKRVLIEKPLFTSSLSEHELRIFESYGGDLIVSSPLRFHNAFVDLSKNLNLVGSVNFIEVRCQSWLPNWRPGRDFRRGFWNEPTQGGVLREIIHELDYLLKLFGPLEVLWATMTDSKLLDLEVESGVSAILRTKSGNIIDLRLDYCSHPPRRHFRIEGDQGTFHWDVLQGTLSFTNSQGVDLKEYPEDRNRNTTFMRQIESLVNSESWDVSGTDLVEANESLKLVEKLYRASGR
jgi:predicted dehydrogenase